jgi:hypothetical protein
VYSLLGSWLLSWSWSLSWSFFPPSPYHSPFIAASFTMPATPPPPPPSPPPAAVTTSPPTSPQLHQQAIQNQERLQCNMGSPELHRIPSASTTLFNALPPPPPSSVSASVTFNGQSYNHLPAHIVSGITNLQPFPITSRRQHSARPPSVSY